MTAAALAAISGGDVRAQAILDWCAATAPAGYRFDAAAAAKACAFFPRYLRHTKGGLFGRPVALHPVQAAMISAIFGWRRPDGSRRFRVVYNEVGRKNGKTTLAAGIALYLAFADGELGAEVYSVANDKDQAGICFREALSMWQQSAVLRQQSLAYKEAIVVGKTNSAYRMMSSKARTKHGLNPHGVIYDEVHEFRDRALFDVMHTGTGARRQPLELLITTAGVDQSSICWEQHDYAVKVRDGAIEDPDFLPLIFAAEPDDDINDPSTWAKANPLMGVSISEEYLRKQAEKAAASPAYENTFRRLHLNQWTEQSVRAISLAAWDACAGPMDWRGLRSALRGRQVFAGLDLSSKSDLTALVLIAPPERPSEPWLVVPYLWCPEAAIEERTRRDRVPYRQWVQQGLIEATPGNVVDYDVIRARISGSDVFRNLTRLPDGVARMEPVEPIAATAVIREIAFDRWNATQIVTQLGDDGHVMVEFGQGFASMAAPTKELIEALIPGGALAHGGHPVLRWMAANLAVRMDPAGNMKPDRERSGGKIDGLVAAIMAIARGLVHKPAVNIYETRGIRII